MKRLFFFFLLFAICSLLDAQNVTPPAGYGYVTGRFYAPVGTKVILQNNGKDDLTLVAANDGSKTYVNMPFQFKTALPESTLCRVTIKLAPKGMNCTVRGVNNRSLDGLIPVWHYAVEVQCEYKYDLASRSTKDSPFSSYYETAAPVISGSLAEEGRYVAFVSYAAGFCGSKGRFRQIFWRDRNTGITKLISTAAKGEEGNGDSFAPVMDVSGRKVVFESYASNLAENDANGVRDIFLWNSQSGTLERINLGPGGIEANGESYEPAIGSNGTIAFTSTASNLTAGVTGTYTPNIYWRNSNSIELISKDPATNKAAGGSKPSVCDLRPGGERIAFCSAASNLVPGDNNGFWDIFLFEPGKPLKRVSLTHNGGERDQGTESATRVVAPSISANGKFIAFASTASNIVPGDNNNAQDVFVVNTETGAVICVSTDSSGKVGNGDSPIGQGERIAIDFAGNSVAFSTRASNLGTPENNIVLHKIQTRQNIAITAVAGSSVGVPSITLAAGYVVFGMGAKLDSRFPSSGIFAAHTNIAGTSYNYNFMNLQ
ncbi:MAG: PD40 domain-containing protein [Chitinophagaceae bacterium]|nr:PD40 domain-containing protein [Chitinophagaceae bacterium]